jgi:GTP-binding protein
MARVASALAKAPAPEVVTDAEVPIIIRPRRHAGDVEVNKVGAVYVVTGAELERLVAGSETSNPEVRRQIAAILTGSRIRPKLQRLGIQPGEKVRVGNFELTW